MQMFTVTHVLDCGHVSTAEVEAETQKQAEYDMVELTQIMRDDGVITRCNNCHQLLYGERE